MTKTPAWRRYLRFWRPDIVADVDEELRFHTEMRVAEYMGRGMAEAEARRAVAERLGNVDAARMECVEQGRLRALRAHNADFIDGLRGDLRFAFRSLGRAPGWTAVAMVTIALGVGATTTVFRVADALLLRPIQYPHASRVFIARREMTIGGGKAYAPMPIAALREWRDHARTIEVAVPFRYFEGDLGDSTEAVTVHGTMIDTSFITFTGAHPVIGRNITAAETMPGGPAAVMLAESFWRRQYGGSPDVIGKIVQLDGRPYTIVGVLPSSVAIPDFRIDPADVWLPLIERQVPLLNGVMVRLKPRVAPDAANAELDMIFQRARLGQPRGFPTAGRAGPRVIPMRTVLTRPGDTLKIRQSIVMLVCAVGLLLLVACTNVAHLLLARGASRQRELAVRHALGAARRRLVRQLVTESLLIASLGAALAVAVGWAGLAILSALRPAEMVALRYVSTGRGVLATASALAIGAGFAIGLLAAMRTAGRDVGAALRSGAVVTALRGRRLRSSLVIGEVALSATLLVGALLLTHAVINLQRTRLGFDARGLYGFSIAVRRGSSPAARAAFAQELLARAARIPGVEGVALAGAAPQPHYWRMLSSLETPEHPVSEKETQGTATNFVAPGYFSMLRMPLLAGHAFDEGSAERNEAIVSISLARQLWPNESPLGHQFRNGLPAPDGSHEPWKTVIGVVPDMVQDLLEGPARQAMYSPLLTTDPKTLPGNTLTLLVRLREDRPAFVDRISTSIATVAPRPVITNIRDGIDESMAEPRFIMRVLAAFALLGVLLAAIGLFGVISYSVGQRTREIGVRMTLGATRASIAGLVIGDGVRLALIGIMMGLLGATMTTRLIESLLYGVSRFDPFSFALGGILLLLVAAVACAVPMWRATAVDPVVAVRAE